MCVTDDAKTIFTGSYDGRVCAWDVASPEAQIIAEEEGKIAHLTAASDGVLYSVQKKEDEIKKISLTDLSTR